MANEEKLEDNSVIQVSRVGLVIRVNRNYKSNIRNVLVLFNVLKITIYLLTLQKA